MHSAVSSSRSIRANSRSTPKNVQFGFSRNRTISDTFVSSPKGGGSRSHLDILKQRNIKVTFFMIGPNVVAHPEIARRALAEGHEIGNHSWTHPQSLSGKWPWGNAFASWGIIAGYDLGTLSD